MHAIKMARTTGRDAEGRQREVGDGRPGRETGSVLYWAGLRATAPAAAVWVG